MALLIGETQSDKLGTPPSQGSCYKRHSSARGSRPHKALAVNTKRNRIRKCIISFKLSSRQDMASLQISKNLLFPQGLDVIPPTRGRKMSSFRFAPRWIFDYQQNQQDCHSASNRSYAQTPMPRAQCFGSFATDNISQTAK